MPGMQIRGSTYPSSNLERQFWNRFPKLLIDDPEDPLNSIIGFIRRSVRRCFINGEDLNLMEQTMTEEQIANYYKITRMKLHQLRKEIHCTKKYYWDIGEMKRKKLKEKL